mmetsp:Transcript_31277/g.28438  ORF Transcript_31277/g.28438 Transcript_31277/m.28438 type:complete len:109 (+) Transcript_31277:388-714(+)
MDVRIANMLLKEADVEADLKPKLQEGDKNQDVSGGPDFNSLLKLASNNMRNLIRLLELNEEDLNEIKKMRKNAPAKEFNFILTCFLALKRLMLKKLSTSAEEKKSHER